MIVVLDSNVWYKELGLRSAAGSAVRLFLRQQEARLVVPEVVRMEVEHQMGARLRDHIESLRSEHRQLLTAFGKLKELVLPTEDEVREKVEGLWASLGIQIEEVPFSLESARSSLLKTVTGTPPSQRGQQFKDGVVWADCLRLLVEDDVVLVTGDKAFYEDHNYGKGLAGPLVAELVGASHSLILRSSLTDLLNEIAAPIEVDLGLLERELFGRFGERLTRLVESQGYGIAESTDATVRPFATEDPNVVFFEFERSYATVDATAQGRPNGVLFLAGDGAYEPESQSFPELRSREEVFEYPGEDGETERRRNVNVYAASVVFGHKEAVHSVRYDLS